MKTSKRNVANKALLWTPEFLDLPMAPLGKGVLGKFMSSWTPQKVPPAFKKHSMAECMMGGALWSVTFNLRTFICCRFTCNWILLWHHILFCHIMHCSTVHSCFEPLPFGSSTSGSDTFSTLAFDLQRGRFVRDDST